MYLCQVKFILNILTILLVLTIAFPQQVMAADSCCSTESTCHPQQEQKEDRVPCDSDCHCTCCFSISVYSHVSKEIKQETQDIISTLVFHYISISDSFFISSIWQPPRLG